MGRDVNVHVKLHTTRACYVTSDGLGGVGGDVNVHVNGHVNPKLMRSIRIWQWRWQSSKENVLEKTGRMLQKRMES